MGYGRSMKKYRVELFLEGQKLGSTTVVDVPLEIAKRCAVNIAKRVPDFVRLVDENSGAEVWSYRPNAGGDDDA